MHPSIQPVAYYDLANRQAVYDTIKADFKVAADTVTGSNQPLRKAHIGEPAAYGGKWVAWVLFRITSQGVSPSAPDRPIPGEVIIQVLTVMPADHKDPTGNLSARGYAEDQTTRGYSAFEGALWGVGVRSKCAKLYIASTAAGSHNEFGRAMFWDEEETTLWAHSADIRVVL